MKIVLTKKNMDILTEEQVKQLYHLVHRREADADGLAYFTGKTFVFFYDHVIASPEFDLYSNLFRAAKTIEKEL